MNNPRDRISTSQVAILISSGLLGVNALQAPQQVVERAGRDGWLALLAGLFLAVGVAAYLVDLGRLFPRQGPGQYNRQIWGVLGGRLLNLWLGLHFLVAVALGVRTFGETVKTYLLERTPLELILFTMLVTIAYLIRQGVNGVARMGEVLFPLTILFLGGVLLIDQVGVDYRNLLPVMARGVRPAMAAMPAAYLAFQGFGSILFLLPFMERPEQGFRAVSAGLAVSGFFHLAVFVTAVGLFGEAELRHLIYPLVDLSRELAFPGLFFSRFDALVLAFWILGAFISMSLAYLAATLLLSQWQGLSEHFPWVYLLLPLVYLLALVPRDLGDIMVLRQVLLYSVLAISLAYFLTWAAARVKLLMRWRGGEGRGAP